MDSNYDIGNSSYGIPFGLNSDGTWSEVESGPTPGGRMVSLGRVPTICRVHATPFVMTLIRGHMCSKADWSQWNRRIPYLNKEPSGFGRAYLSGVGKRGISSRRSNWSTSNQTSGTIYPGFIDPHNHAKYNLIPLWDHGTDGWDNRYQWQSYSGYSDAKDIGCSISDPMAMRFAELRAIVGGNTAIQGSANTNTDSFDSILTRNIELYNFNKDFIHTKVTELESDYSGNHIKTGNSSGSWTHGSCISLKA